MGTPDLARAVLARLADANIANLVGVVAQPDKPVGRHLQLTPPPVKVEALARNLPVLQPLKARDPQFLAELAAWKPDVIVVAAYGQILPQALLDIPPHGCLNVHTSLLPRWRGAAPIQWAIAEGDPETGVCIMRMEAGLDTGPVISTSRTPISDADTGRALHDRLADLGADLLVRTLPDWIEGRLAAVPQPAEGVTYARKISREDGRIDWNRPATVIARRARAFDPWPGSFCLIPGADGSPGRTLKIHSLEALESDAHPLEPGNVIPARPGELVVRCGTGALRLLEVQPEGGKRMPAAAFLAGNPVARLA